MKRNILFFSSLLGLSLFCWNAYGQSPDTSDPETADASILRQNDDSAESDGVFTPDNKRLRADGPTRRLKHAPTPDSIEEPLMLSKDVPLTPPRRVDESDVTKAESDYQLVQFFFNRRRGGGGGGGGFFQQDQGFSSQSGGFFQSTDKAPLSMSTPSAGPQVQALTPEQAQQVQNQRQQQSLQKNAPKTQGQAQQGKTEQVKKPELSPEEQFKLSIRNTLAANSKRQISTMNNSPGDVLLMALPYGADAMVYQPATTMDPRDRKVPKGSYIYSIGTLCWNYPCFGKTLLRTDGQRVFARTGAGYQLRPSSFLALLAMSNIMPSYELKVSNGLYTIGHLVASEKASVSKGSNMSLTLVGLSFYSEPTETWKNEMGETWSIEKMVTEELKRPVNQGTSEATDWLLGLTAAVKLYEDEGKPLKGAIALAKQQVAIYQDFVMSVQNENGVWHPKFFLFKGTHPDVFETMYSSGHILRWLMTSMSDQQIESPKMKAAITSLAGLVNRVPMNVQPGSMTDRQLEALAVSLHALSLYNQRVYGVDEPEEKEAANAPTTAIKEVATSPTPVRK